MARLQAKDSLTTGQLTRRIQIQALTLIPDGYSKNEDWNTIYSPLADIQNLPHGRGLSRQFKFMQLYPEANTIIQIRYVPNMNINASMRILSDENGLVHEYKIVGPPVNMNRANISIYIPCMETQAKGVN
jgi:head-tail adaptor